MMDSSPEIPQRKRPVHRVVEHRDRPTMVFLTVCTKSRRPVLCNQPVHALLREVWLAAGSWVVGRYVIMPDHVHLFAGVGSPQLPLTNWVSFWKRAFTRRHGVALWQDDYWDTTLRNASHAGERWEYIRQNPVRAGLVAGADDWQWQGEVHRLRW